MVERFDLSVSLVVRQFAFGSLENFDLSADLRRELVDSKVIVHL